MSNSIPRSFKALCSSKGITTVTRFNRPSEWQYLSYLGICTEPKRSDFCCNAVMKWKYVSNDIQFYSFTGSKFYRRFFARMCLYLLALVKFWGIANSYKNYANYAFSLYIPFLMHSPLGYFFERYIVFSVASVAFL